MALVLLVTCIRVILNLPGSAFPGADEPRWTATGRYAFDRLFVAHDFSARTWSDPAFTRYGARNPPVGKLLFGAFQVIAGEGEQFTTRETVLELWRPDPDREHDLPAIHAVRRGNAALLVVAAGALYRIALVLTASPPLAALAALLLAFDPFMSKLSFMAMTDIPMLAFGLVLLCVTLACLRSIRSAQIGRACATGALAGCCAAVAVGTKLNALVFVLVAFAWLGLTQIPGPTVLGPITGSPSRKAVAASLSVALLTGGIFWVLPNPLLWKAPVEQTRVLLSYGAELSSVAQNPGGLLQAMRPTPRVKDRVAPIIEFARTGPLNTATGMRSIDIWLIAFGIIAWMAAVAGQAGVMPRSGAILLGVWAGVAVAGQLAWTPFAWPRYHFPLEPCFAIFEALALWTIVRLVLAAITNAQRAKGIPTTERPVR